MDASVLPIILSHGMGFTRVPYHDLAWALGAETATRQLLTSMRHDMLYVDPDSLHVPVYPMGIIVSIRDCKRIIELIAKRLVQAHKRYRKVNGSKDAAAVALALYPSLPMRFTNYEQTCDCWLRIISMLVEGQAIMEAVQAKYEKALGNFDNIRRSLTYEIDAFEM